MGNLVTYDVADGVATVVMDDGKVNVLSLRMLAAIHEALDRAEADRAAVVLAGRTGVFSAGFDLGTLRAGGPDGVAMGRGGFALAARVLSFPFPLWPRARDTPSRWARSCSAPATTASARPVRSSSPPMRSRSDFPYPKSRSRFSVTGSRRRRSTARSTLAEVSTPDIAVENGYLDRVVAPESVLGEAQELARTLTSLDLAAHAATKLTVRRSTLDLLAAALASDRALIDGLDRPRAAVPVRPTTAGRREHG